MFKCEKKEDFLHKFRGNKQGRDFGSSSKKFNSFLSNSIIQLSHLHAMPAAAMWPAGTL